MNQLNLSNDPVNKTKKITRLLMLIGAGIATFWFWGTISSFVVRTLEDTLKTVLYGGILAAIILFVWQNPTFIAQTWTNFNRFITGIFIKMDFLSYMDRYAEYLLEKKKNLDASIVSLAGKKEKLDRKLAAWEEAIRTNLRRAETALQLGQKQEAALLGTKVAGDKKSIEMFRPMQQKMTKYIDFMSKLSESWNYSRESLLYEIDRKRTEYEMIKETTKGLKNAEELINSDSEAARIYGESLKALEENVTQKIAYIEDFERRSKDIIAGINIDQQMMENDGLKVLEEYINDGELFLPNFSQVGQEIDYVEVKSGKSENSNFKFLK